MNIGVKYNNIDANEISYSCYKIDEFEIEYMNEICDLDQDIKKSILLLNNNTYHKDPFKFDPLNNLYTNPIDLNENEYNKCDVKLTVIINIITVGVRYIFCCSKTKYSYYQINESSLNQDNKKFILELNNTENHDGDPLNRYANYNDLNFELEDSNKFEFNKCDIKFTVIVC